MENKTIKTVLFFAVSFFAFFIHGCAAAKPVSYYQSASGISEETRNASPETIDAWVASGDRAYESGQFETARDFYYRAVMANSGRADAVVSYGACLTNLGFYENAIQIYNIALRIDPYEPIANSNLELTQQLLAERTDQERTAELQWRQQQQDNLNNLIASLNSTASSIQQLQQGSNQVSQVPSATSGGQGQAGTSSGSTKSASTYQAQYDRYARLVQGNVSSLTKMTFGTVSYNRLLQIMRANQRDMRRLREEAFRNGINIWQSPWENA